MNAAESTFNAWRTQRSDLKNEIENLKKINDERDERVKILVNSCIRKMDRIGMRRIKKSCAARPRESGRHEVSEFRRAVSMKIAVRNR